MLKITCYDECEAYTNESHENITNIKKGPLRDINLFMFVSSHISSTSVIHTKRKFNPHKIAETNLFKFIKDLN